MIQSCVSILLNSILAGINLEAFHRRGWISQIPDVYFFVLYIVFLKSDRLKLYFGIVTHHNWQDTNKMKGNQKKSAGKDDDKEASGPLEIIRAQRGHEMAIEYPVEKGIFHGRTPTHLIHHRQMIHIFYLK